MTHYRFDYQFEDEAITSTTPAEFATDADALHSWDQFARGRDNRVRFLAIYRLDGTRWTRVPSS